MRTTPKDAARRFAAPEDFGHTDEDAPPRAKLQRILVPVDFTPASLPTLRYAAMLAERLGSTIWLLHVIEAHPFAMSEVALILTKSDEDMNRDTTEQLNRLAREELPPDLRVQPLVRRGKPAAEILNAAETLEADLIILAAHRRSRLGRLLLGSTVAQVERHHRCPLLVVRRDDDSGVEMAFWQGARGGMDRLQPKTSYMTPT